MANQLPVVTLNGKQYYLDIRLNQLRTVTMEGPIEFLEIDDLYDDDYVQIQSEYLKAMGIERKF